MEKLTKKEKLQLTELKQKIKKLIERGDDETTLKKLNMIDDIKEFTISNPSILRYVSGHGRISVLKYLIEHGASVNATEENGNSPIIVACNNKHFEIAQILVHAGADVNFTNNEKSALYIASSCNEINFVQLLLESNINIEKFGGYALLEACNKNYIEISRLLVQYGSNVNYLDLFNSTPLHLACANNNLELIKLLMDHGADENITNKNNKNPIEMTNNEEIINFIKSYTSSNFLLK